MKSIKKIRLSITTALATVAVASLAMGLNLINPISADAENRVVNGWNSEVTRGTAAVDLGVAAKENYAEFKNLQDGDVLSYASTVKAPIRSDLVRATPYAFSVIAKGSANATISWTFTATGMTAPLRFTTVIGGDSLRSETEGKGDCVYYEGNHQRRTYNSGDQLTVIVDGHHKFNNRLFYMNTDGTMTVASSMRDTNLLGENGEIAYEEFNVAVEVTGEVSDLKVKVGEALKVTAIDTSTDPWSWAGFNAPFEALSAGDAFRGIYSPEKNDALNYWAFKGFPISFKFKSTQADAIPYVTVGGQRVDSDKSVTTAGERGWYNYFIPQDAAQAAINIVEGAEGFSPYVKRGDQSVKVTAEETDNYYAKFTGLESGDVISYNGTVKAPIRSDLVRATPYAFSVIAKGSANATVSWTLTAPGMTAPLRFTTVIGGDSLRSETEGKGDCVYYEGNHQRRTYNSGDQLTVIVDGHHKFNNRLFYMNPDGTMTVASSMRDTNLLGENGEIAYEEFNVAVEVTGEISELQLKVGEALKFTSYSTSTNPWTWAGFNAPFQALSAEDAFRGIFAPQNNDYANYWVFKGFPISFKFSSTEEGAIPYVTVGGQRADSDGTATGYGERGWYNYTIPASATSAALEITASDLNVSLMDGEKEFMKVPVGFNEKFTAPAKVEKLGFVADGYYTDAALETPFDFNTPITANTNLYIKWKQVTHLTYLVDGQAYAYQNFEEAGVPTLPQDPQKEGMGFLGWYTAENGSTEFDFTQQITKDTNAYAVFGFNLTYQILGFNAPDGSQYKNVVVKEGDSVATAEIPDYAAITGRLPYDAFKIEWYTNAEMTEKATFPYTPSASTGLYGCLVDTKDYFKYVSEYGWDMSSGVRSQETLIDGKEIPLTESEYGPLEKIADGENGYSSLRLNYEGYIVNTRKLDVGKDIYLDMSIDTTCDDAAYAQAPAGTPKWFMFGLFNSLNAALTSEGPNSHRGGFGVLSLFGFNLVENTTALSGDSWTKSVHPVPGTFNFTGGKKLDLTHFVIVIGETKAESGIYVVGEDGTRTLAATLDLQRSMFPNGMYFMASCFRMSDFNIRLTQESSIAVGSQEKGTYSLSKTTGVAGEKVYIENIAPKAGYSFTTKSVYANGKALAIESEEVGGETKYYFALPFGEDITLEIRWAVKVTFIADDQEVGSAIVVPGNKVLNKDMPDPPVKTGHTFDGWYKDAAFTQAYNRDTDLIEDVMTIYAKFTAETYTITFMSDGAQHSTATAAYGEKFTPAEITKEGYTFGGWYTDEGCTTAYDFDTAVSGNVTVYAKWTPVGSGDSTSDSTTSTGDSQSEPSTQAGCKGGCKGVAGFGGLLAGLTLAGAAIVLAIRKKSE